jgi:hypothetical protein
MRSICTPVCQTCQKITASAPTWFCACAKSPVDSRASRQNPYLAGWPSWGLIFVGSVSPDDQSLGDDQKGKLKRLGKALEAGPRGQTTRKLHVLGSTQSLRPSTLYSDHQRYVSGRDGVQVDGEGTCPTQRYDQLRPPDALGFLSSSWRSQHKTGTVVALPCSRGISDT